MAKLPTNLEAKIGDAAALAASVTLMTAMASMAVPDLNHVIIYDPAKFQTLTDAVFKKRSPAASLFNTGLAVSNAELQLSILSAINPSIFRFSINPTSVRVSKAKSKNIVETKEGWDHNYFKNKLLNISYKGVTGYLKPPIVQLSELGLSPKSLETLESAALLGNVMEDIRLSPAWLHFQQFNDFYDKATGDLVLIWDGIFYKGIFDDFDWDQDAHNISLINYHFTFLGYPDQVANIFTHVPTFLTAF